MSKAIVVGGGLFGQIIAKKLRVDGWDVDVYDSGEPGAGSPPAACLMKPSWFSSLGRDVYDPALKTLAELYDVQEVIFKLQPFKSGGKIGKASVYWINPAEILNAPVIREKIIHIDLEEQMILTASQYQERVSLIVVAAGIWSEKLLHQYTQVGQKGVAWLWPTVKVKEPFIWPWAPYRQLVAMNRGDGLWVSDGTAIKQENWTTMHEQKSRDRCTGAIGLPQSPKRIVGIRPYAKVKPCLLEEAAPGVWIASGGAKNGTLAAGYCAHVISERYG